MNEECKEQRRQTMEFLFAEKLLLEDGEEDEDVFTLDEATLDEINKDRRKLVLFIKQLTNQIQLILPKQWSYLT